MAPPAKSLPLTSISPARLERLLACPLRVAFDQARPSGTATPPSPWALVGLAIHRTIELCLDDDPPAMDAAWEQACDELAKDVVDPRSAPTARRSFLRLERRLPDLLAYVTDRAPHEKLREHVLTSPDGLLTGQVDLLLLGDRPSIVDHKSGLVLTEGVPRAHFQRQLAIYAWLADVTLGVRVTEAALFSLREGIVELDVSPGVRDAIVADALHRRDAFNARTPGPQPATPSDDACGTCPYVGPCDPAWQAIRTGLVDRFGWGEAVRGTLRRPVVVAAAGRAAVPLNIEVGTVSGEAVLVDVPATLVLDLSPGELLAAWRLDQRSDEPLTLAWHEGRSGLEVLA